MSKERPILFSAPMVRAILEGRKTQTRRVIKPQPKSDSFRVGHFHQTCVDLRGNEYPSCDETFGIYSEDGEWSTKCPYGSVGDRLWVRETWLCVTGGPGPITCSYRADHTKFQFSGLWKPSIHMPRWASRITLEITGVRVEPLSEISYRDAFREGFAKITKDGSLFKYGIPDRDGLPGTDDHGWPWGDWEVDARKAFIRLWESINGAGSWVLNPWVWVVEFKHVENVSHE